MRPTHANRTRKLLAVIAAVTVTTAACGSSSSQNAASDTTAAPTETTTTQPAAETTASSEPETEESVEEEERELGPFRLTGTTNDRNYTIIDFDLEPGDAVRYWMVPTSINPETGLTYDLSASTFALPNRSERSHLSSVEGDRGDELVSETEGFEAVNLRRAEVGLNLGDGLRQHPSGLMVPVRLEFLDSPPSLGFSQSGPHNPEGPNAGVIDPTETRAHRQGGWGIFLATYRGNYRIVVHGNPEDGPVEFALNYEIQEPAIEIERNLRGTYFTADTFAATVLLHSEFWFAPGFYRHHGTASPYGEFERFQTRDFLQPGLRDNLFCQGLMYVAREDPEDPESIEIRCYER